MSEFALRPSASYLWTNCTAYPSFAQNVPYEDAEVSDAAREGTCAAWVAECVIKGLAPSCVDMIGMAHANGWFVDEEMAYHVQGYVNEVKRDSVGVSAETTVQISPRIGGSLDSSAINLSGVTLKIKDLKYGHDPVYAFQNSQLLIYGAGEYRRLGCPPSVERVELTIYQPRVPRKEGCSDTWIITVAELLQWEAWIIARGDECFDNPTPTPGKHCKNCKAAATCEKAIHVVMANHAALRSTAQMHKTPGQMADMLAFMEVHEAILKGVKTALVAEAEQRVKMGENIIGWGMKERYGNRKFTVTPLHIAMKTGKNPNKDVLKTPAELEREGANTEIVNTISTRPFIGSKIGRVDTGRFFE